MLTDWVSWRWGLFINVPIGIGLVFAARKVLTETPPEKGKFDVAGALTSTLGITSLVFGFIRVAEAGWRRLRYWSRSRPVSSCWSRSC